MVSTMVSIVVPVYNAERYLGECIESILSQTYREWELILVNDGSTDSSGEICDHYTADARVRVIHKQNEGVTSARRDGVMAANAEWIFFVDADDKVEINGLKGLIEYADNHPGCDVVEGSYKWFYPDGSMKQRPCAAKEDGAIEMTGEEYAISICSGRHGATGPWMKLIRRSVLTQCGALDIIPRKFTNREDTLMNVIVAQYICKYALISEPVYLYRNQFGNSAISNKLSWAYWIDYLEFFRNSIPSDWRGHKNSVFAAHAVDVFKMMVHGKDSFIEVPESFYKSIVPVLWANRHVLPKSDRVILAGFRIPQKLGLPISWSILWLLQCKNRLFNSYYAKRSRRQ